jgi:hypothetical protein
VTGPTTPPPLRYFTVEVGFEGGVTRWPTVATTAREAVRLVMRLEDVPATTVRAVYRWPTCDYCTRIAQLYVKDSGDVTPLCKRCALGQYTTAGKVTKATGELTPGTLVRLPVEQWRVYDGEEIDHD